MSQGVILYHSLNRCNVVFLLIKDVVSACNKVLSIPGQSETNYDALFLMGYASMRLEDYHSAAEHFLRAYQIDS